MTERRQKAATASVELEDIDLEEAKAAIENLTEVLEDATPEEKKALMRENVAEILIPKNEEPLLVSNPEGLLTSLGCPSRAHTGQGSGWTVPSMRSFHLLRPPEFFRLAPDFVQFHLQKDDALPVCIVR